jgi:hypothetical protein
VRDTYADVLGKEIRGRLKPIWGVDDEGELNSVFRDTGVPRLYAMIGASGRHLVVVNGTQTVTRSTGNFQLSRVFSRHVALRTWPRIV